MKTAKDEVVPAPDTYVAPGAKSETVVPPAEEEDGDVEVSLTFKEIPVKLIVPDPEDSEKEVTHNCIIRQLTGKQRDQYLQMIRSRSKVHTDGKTLIIQNIEGLETTLVQWSFYRVEKTPQGRKLIQYKLEEIDSWPDEARSIIYKRSSKLSKLDKEEKKKGGDDEGNE